MPAGNDEIDTESRASAESTNLRPEDSVEAITSLDGLAAEVTGKKPDPVPPVTPKPSEDAAATAAAKKAEEDAAAAAASKTADIQPKPGEDAAAAAKKAEEDAAAPAKDPLDEIELPPHTKPKTAESFSNLRTAAKQLVAAATEKTNSLQTQVSNLTQQIEELKKTAGQVPEAVQKELEELRKGHAVADIESDPDIRKFDDQITANNEVIYKRLKTAGYSDEHIAKIKELGGPAAIEWEPILAKMPIPARRFIESTLVESERLTNQKEAAVTKAKSNAEEYSKGRAARDLQQVSDAASQYVKNLAWANEREVPSNATPEEKAAIEEANKAARGAQATLQKYLADRSPGRFAELAVGTLIAHKLNSDVIALRAAAKESETKIASLTKERDEFKAKLESIKNAQVPRGRKDPVTSVAKPTPETDISGAENLDALADQERARSND